jgi:MFS family permease
MNRIIEALCTAHAINDGTTVLVPTLLPIAAGLFHVGYLELGLLVAIGYSVNMIVQPLVGKSLGRYEAGALLALGVTIMAISMIVIALSNSYAELLLGVVILRIGSSFYHPIGPTIVSRTYPKAMVDRQMGVTSGFGDLGSFIMFLGTSFLYTALGWKFPFLIFGILDFLIALIALKYLRPIPDYRSHEHLNVAHEKLTNVKSPISREPLPLSILFVATFVTGGAYAVFLNFANSAMVGIYHSFLLANLPVSLWLLSFLFADFSTGLFSRRIGRLRLLVIAYLISGISAVLFSQTYGSPVLASLTLLINGFMLSFTAPLTYAEIGTRSSVEGGGRLGLGTLFGLLFSFQVVGSALFSYLAGDISQFFNPVYPFEIISGVLIAVALLIMMQRM